MDGPKRVIKEPTFCAECGYNLQRLPLQHVCPECGHRYDARSRSRRGILEETALTFPKLEVLGFGLCILVLFVSLIGIIKQPSTAGYAVGATYVAITAVYGIHANKRVQKCLHSRRMIKQNDEES